MVSIPAQFQSASVRFERRWPVGPLPVQQSRWRGRTRRVAVLLQGSEIHRSRNQEPLRSVTAELTHRVSLSLLLNTLGDGRESERGCHRDDPADDRGARRRGEAP